MPSKFIKNSRISNSPKSFTTPTTNEYAWYSMGESKQEAEEKKQMEEYRQKMKSEKARIEAIPLEELFFRDIYTMPFVDMMGMGRIYSGNDFTFQFLAGGEETKQKCLQILNGLVLTQKVVKIRKKIDKTTKKPTGEEENYLGTERWYFPKLSQAIKKYIQLSGNKATSIEELKEILLRIENTIETKLIFDFK